MPFAQRAAPRCQMSALTEVSEADELKAAVAATGEPRLIALLERLAVVEGKLADGSDLRAAIDAWSPPTSSGQAAKTRLAQLLTRLEAVHKSYCRGASPPLLNHDLHAIDATSARWRGHVGASPLDGVSRAPDSLVDLCTGVGRGALSGSASQNDGTARPPPPDAAEGMYAARNPKNARHDQDAEGAVSVLVAVFFQTEASEQGFS